ncbi:TPA: hypothetical protein ACGO7R_000076 [Streptococcus suis]
MKKKLFSLCATGLVLLGLTACSTTSKESTSASSSEASSSSTVASSTTESSKTVLKESTVTYLTDEEIQNIVTIGDFKAAFKSLMDSYIADFEELIAQLPEEQQGTLLETRDQLVVSLEEQYALLDQQFAVIGGDETEIPADVKDMLLTTVTTVRDQLKSAMDSARSQVEELLQ